MTRWEVLRLWARLQSGGSMQVLAVRIAPGGGQRYEILVQDPDGGWPFWVNNERTLRRGASPRRARAAAPEA